MSDRREEILNAELGKFVVEKGVSSIYPKNFPEAYKSPAISAMDQYMTECCLSLLQYIADKNIKVSFLTNSQEPMFMCGMEALTKEQVFENFL